MPDQIELVARNVTFHKRNKFCLDEVWADHLRTNSPDAMWPKRHYSAPSNATTRAPISRTSTRAPRSSQTVMKCKLNVWHWQSQGLRLITTSCASTEWLSKMLLSSLHASLLPMLWRVFEHLGYRHFSRTIIRHLSSFQHSNSAKQC